MTGTGIRRHPDAVIVAHSMDPARRELYVEGSRDRLFLMWLFREAMNANALIREIALVDIEGSVEGGERGRLLAFGTWLQGKQVQVRCFADADYDRIFSRPAPPCVWFTDGRDLEGYVLTLPCFEKVLGVGIGTDAISPAKLLKSVITHCRSLGVLRILSEKECLRLPFQKTKLRRYVKYSNGTLSVRFNDYLRALLQNACISLAHLPTIQNQLASVQRELEGIPDAELVHGKDALCLLERALERFDMGPNEPSRLLWVSFEKNQVQAGSSLSVVANFHTSASS